MASAIPGTSRSSTARVASGVPSVGDSPVPPVVSDHVGRRRPAPPRSASSTGRAVGHDRRVRRPRSPSSRSASTMQGAAAVGVDAGRRPGRAGDDDARRHGSRSARDPVAGPAAGLGGDPHVGDAGVLVDRLDHVDQRQRRRRRPRSAPPSRCRCGRPCAPSRAMSTPSSATSRSTSTPCTRDRVRQRDQLGGALGGLDAGDPGDGERVALGHRAAAQRRDRVGGQQDPAGRRRRPGRDVLGR